MDEKEYNDVRQRDDLFPDYRLSFCCGFDTEERKKKKMSILLLKMSILCFF